MRRMHQPDFITEATIDAGPEEPPNAPLGPLEPTLAAAHARIAAIRPAAYACTRNAIDGAVSGLSPWITHGFVSLAEVLAAVNARQPLSIQHKFVYELGWRAYFRHVWQHRGEAIFSDLHAGLLPASAYAPQLPQDIREGRTGIAVIDAAVRELYASGTLHNHARMWLASYIVHLRKVHWRAGADWMYAHLLDGDLASNHLSWQWVAGTGSRKPYLFNAENVARHAPAAWHCAGSVLDCSYEALDQLARQGEPAASPGVAGPAALDEPRLCGALPQGLAATVPDAKVIDGREVWLVHPWSLGVLPRGLAPQTLVIGCFIDDFHRRWPWSERRWRFVATRMAALADVCWHGDAAAWAPALARARRVRCLAEPHLAPWLPPGGERLPTPQLFAPIDQPCASFSQWWSRATRGLGTAADLLAANEVRAAVAEEVPPWDGDCHRVVGTGVAAQSAGQTGSIT